MNLPEQLARAAALDTNLPDESYVMVARALRGLDPITGEPDVEKPTAGALPTPPDGDTRWSIVTLAQQLCVPPAAVALEIAPDDMHSNRLFATYTGADREDYGDIWFTHDAAERIAGALSTGLLARRIYAGDPGEARHVPADQVWALARHIVEHLGGEQ